MGLEGGDPLDPLPGLPLSIPDPRLSFTGGVPLPAGGEVTLLGETTLLAGEVSLSGGDDALGVLPLELVPPRLGVPGLPALSFKLPLFVGLLVDVPPAWNKSASRSSRS